MKFGLAISALLHASIILFAAYGLPRLMTPLEVKEEPLLVELVTIADETTPQPAAPDEPLPPPEADEPPPPPEVAMALPPAPPKLELAPPPPPEPKMAEPPPPPPPPPLPKIEKRPPPPPPPPKLAMATPPATRKLPPPPPTPPPAPKPVVQKAPPPLPKVPKAPAPKPPKKVVAKLPQTPRPRAKPKPPKKDFTKTLDRISALLDKSEEKHQAPAERTEKSTRPRTQPQRQVPTRTLASQSEERELTIREMDALVLTIRKLIEDCWRVPGGARDAENLVVRVRFQLNRDGSLVRPPEVVDLARMLAEGGEFFRTAAESARRAVLRCSPLGQLPQDKYDYWREVTLTFNPKDMLR